VSNPLNAELVFHYAAPVRFAVAVVSPPSNPTVGGGFREVAEGLHHALLALGHDSVLTTRLDLDERRTIVFGANHLVHYGLQIPRNPIFYNLEQLGDDSPWMAMPEFFDLFRRYPNWDYSQANIEYLATVGLPRPTYVPIGYVPELTRIAPAPEDIDVLFYGMLSERRYAVLRDLHDRGLRVKWLSGALGASRDAWIARSKIVLNVHYWEAKIFEIARVSYLLANKRAVVSENGADPLLERGLESGIVFANYHELVDRCVELLGDEPARRELAERGYQAFSAVDQAAVVDRALAGLEDVTLHTDARGDRRFDVRPHDHDHGADHQLRDRNLLRHKSEQERDRLLANVQRNPTDARSALFLAQTYFQLGDIYMARKWYARRIEMGGCDEEVFYAMYWLAQSMQQFGEPWRDVEDAYLRAWYFRPTRAEPLLPIATAYRQGKRYRLAYLFAQRAAVIPVPEGDLLLPAEIAQVYAWRAADERAVCASWIGQHSEAFALCRRLLARTDIPEPDRQRIAANRDFSVPAMVEVAATYPEARVRSLATDPGEADVAVSLIAGPDLRATEDTINSFLTCCLDVSRVGRFVVLDTGLSDPDRAKLRKRYGFLEFAGRRSGDGPAAQLAALRAQIDGRFWLHLGEGWRFFAPENYITRLTAVLDAEPQVFQVGINFADAVELTGASAAEQAIRRRPHTGRYLLTEKMAIGPAMFDTARLDRALGARDSDPDPPAQRSRPTASAGLHTASLDEVLCISGLHP
jgi:tetratricopeptide (TPR) repeat protein